MFAQPEKNNRNNEITTLWANFHPSLRHLHRLNKTNSLDCHVACQLPFFDDIVAINVLGRYGICTEVICLCLEFIIFITFLSLFSAPGTVIDIK
jgi:hypothetical protein